ncbi:MAG: class I SAM-dependent methyltransferase, partial [Patescibacteria group bacterium]
LAEESYDAALCFEVLEHLARPNKTLAEIHNVLKPGGILYVGQPNMRADGAHHVRRYYLKPLLEDLSKAGFAVEWVDYVPAYSMRDSILDDIRNNPSFIRKIVQCVNLGLSFLPRSIRYRMAAVVPDRFALMLIVKAIKT